MKFGLLSHWMALLCAGIRAQLVLLILIPLLLASGVFVFNAMEQRRSLVKDAQLKVSSQIKDATENLLHSILVNANVLKILAKIPIVKEAEEPECSILLKSLVETEPRYTSFFVVDALGQAHCGSDPDHRKVNIKDWDTFKTTMRSLHPIIGQPMTDIVTKKFLIPITYPILNRYDQVIGLLVSGVDLSSFGESIVKEISYFGGSFSVWDSKGQILYHYPDISRKGTLGKNHALATEILKSKGARTVEAIGVDGKLNFFAISDLPAYEFLGLKLAIGIPKNELFATPNKQLMRSLILLSIVLTVVLMTSNLLATRSIVKPVDRLLEAAKNLEAGRLRNKISEPLPPGELGEVAHALNDAMTSLQSQRDVVIRLNNVLEDRVAARTAQLEAANKELEAFSYSVSHDLRAPLRHIQGYIELLFKEADDRLSPKAKRYLQTISDSAARLGELTDDFLTFSRMQRAEMRETKIDLFTLVTGVVGQLKPAASDRKIEWKIGFLPEVMGDPAMLKQVLLNLIENAIKYTRPRDPAVIEIGCVGEENSRYILFVQDNGVGFDMQYANKLFGVFQRLHSDAEFEGTGIGLANVSRIIARHGGRVWAQADPDKGATFYFTLKGIERDSPFVEERKSTTSVLLAANSAGR